MSDEDATALLPNMSTACCCCCCCCWSCFDDDDVVVVGCDPPLAVSLAAPPNNVPRKGIPTMDPIRSAFIPMPPPPPPSSGFVCCLVSVSFPFPFAPPNGTLAGLFPLAEFPTPFTAFPTPFMAFPTLLANAPKKLMICSILYGELYFGGVH